MNSFGNINLIGRRIAIRRLRASDLARAARWLSDADTARLLGVNTPVTPEGQRKWFADSRADNTKLVCAITLRRGGRHVGNIALRAVNRRDNNASLNIFIGDPKDRNRGYAGEAINLFLDYCFDTLGLHRVWLDVYEDNAAARHLYEKTGFRQEGLLRRHARVQGRYVDKIIMGILSDERKR